MFVVLLIYMCSKNCNNQESCLIQLFILVPHVKCKNCNGLIVHVGSVKERHLTFSRLYSNSLQNDK